MLLIGVVSYDMYIYCEGGGVDLIWEESYPVNFWTFGNFISRQTLKYSSL